MAQHIYVYQSCQPSKHFLSAPNDPKKSFIIAPVTADSQILTPAVINIYVYFFVFFKELLKRSESKLLRCHKHADVRTRGKSGKVIRWPWKITCGICNKNIQMRYDSDLKGRISYFDRRKSNVRSVKGNRLSDSKSSGTHYF